MENIIIKLLPFTYDVGFSFKSFRYEEIDILKSVKSLFIRTPSQLKQIIITVLSSSLKQSSK